MNGHQDCSHQWQDEATRGQFVSHALSVAPYIDPGNWQAMQPGHTYVCVKCERSLTIPDTLTENQSDHRGPVEAGDNPERDATTFDCSDKHPSGGATMVTRLQELAERVREWFSRSQDRGMEL